MDGKNINTLASLSLRESTFEFKRVMSEVIRLSAGIDHPVKSGVTGRSRVLPPLTTFSHNSTLAPIVAAPLRFHGLASFTGATCFGSSPP